MIRLKTLSLTVRLVALFASVGHAATFTVTNTNDSGAGSLRQAILDANGDGVTDNINFNIATGPFTIQPASALPTITNPVIIDGYTQTGATAATSSAAATLVIEIDGTNTGGTCLNISAGSSTVRGLVINRCPSSAISLAGGTGDTIEGNYLGTNVAGTADLGNGTAGVISATSATIGGATAAKRNLISGNGGCGLNVNSNNTIQGNYVGTDVTGMTKIQNDNEGIIVNGNGNTIGGTAAGAGNIFSGSLFNGILLNSDNNVVQGNLIGTDVNGTGNLGNSSNGVQIFGDNNTIGGSGNTIAFNGGDGVNLGAAATENSIKKNSIFENTGLGIDLNPDGITANDTNDGDTGANNLQNFPVLNNANVGSTIITGTLNSLATTTYRIEYFENPACDASGNGEGKTFLGFDDVTTDGGGNVTFTSTLTTTATLGRSITATATDPSGNTSEFSACITMVPTMTEYTFILLAMTVLTLALWKLR